MVQRRVAITGPSKPPPTRLPERRTPRKVVWTFANQSCLEAFEISDSNAVPRIHSAGGLELLPNKGGQVTSKQSFRWPIIVDCHTYCGPRRVAGLNIGYGGISVLYGGWDNTKTSIRVAGRDTLFLPHRRIAPNRVYRLTIAVDEDRNAQIGIDGKIVHTAKLPNDSPMEAPVFVSFTRGHVIVKSIVVQELRAE